MPNATKFPQRQTLLRAAMLVALGLMSFALVKPSLSQSAGFTTPFNANSIWNKPISSNPALHPNSAQMIQLLASTINGAINIDGINGAWSVPVYYADSTVPLQTVCDLHKYAPCESVPVPVGLRPSPDSDAKTVIVDISANPQRAWSFWEFTQNGSGWTASQGAFGWANISNSGDGIHNYGGGAWGGRVSSWNYYAGLIFPQEIAQGHIDHALLISIPSSVAANAPVWPALAGDGRSSSPNAIPVGSHIQLDPSIDVNALPLSPGGKAIARAMQVYGAWVGDTGSMAAFSAREFINANGTIDSTPWLGLLTYRDMYTNFPVNRLRVLQTNPGEYYQEPPGGVKPSTTLPPTNTPVPPTNTPVPPTNTPVPPTDIPPSDTPIPATPVPPTNIPPTSTALPTTVAMCGAGTLPQILTMAGTSKAYTYTSLVTDPSKTYRITVSGVVRYWSGNSGYQTDARYATWNGWGRTLLVPVPQFRYEDGTVPVPDDPQYRADHTYTFTRQGTCAPFGFWLYDTNYTDNAGALTVTITEAASVAPVQVPGAPNEGQAPTQSQPDPVQPTPIQPTATGVGAQAPSVVESTPVIPTAVPVVPTVIVAPTFPVNLPTTEVILPTAPSLPGDSANSAGAPAGPVGAPAESLPATPQN